MRFPTTWYVRPAKAQTSLLEYSMTVKLLTEHNLEFLGLKEAVQARLSQQLSKCHIVGNHMSRLICKGYSPVNI